MVPFWQRRLLAVTLPMGMACAWCWLTAATQMAARIDVAPTVSFRWWISGGRTAVGWSFVSFCVPIAAAVLLLAKPVRRLALGGSGVASIAAGGAFVLFWLQAMMMLAVIGLSDVLTTRLQISHLYIAGLNLIGVSLLIVVWRAFRVRPREQALVVLGRSACWLGLIGCAVFVPFAAIDLRNEPSGFAKQHFNATEMQWDTSRMRQAVLCGLHLGVGGALIACFAGHLARRHSTYHATHCHRCGYELIGVEGYSCPECGFPITRAQSNHIAQLTTNGSQGSSSSPTTST